MDKGTLLLNIEVPKEWVFWIFNNNNTPDELYIYGKRRVPSNDNSVWKEIVLSGKECDCFSFLEFLIGKNLETNQITNEVNVGIYSTDLQLPSIFSKNYIKSLLSFIKETRDELVLYENVKLTLKLFQIFVGFLKTINVCGSS